MANHHPGILSCLRRMGARAPVLLVCLIAAGIALAAPAHAQGLSYDLPVDQYVGIGCTVNSFDLVHVTGTIHLVFSVTYDAAGGVEEHTTTNYHDMIGVGFFTGVTYHVVGADIFTGTINGGPYLTTWTEVDQLHFLGQGSNFNFLGEATLHYTINADGSLTAVVDQMHNSCP